MLATIKQEKVWHNLTHFAKDVDTHNVQNINSIVKEYPKLRKAMGKSLVVSDNIMGELYAYTDSDTAVIQKIIDKYWCGLWYVYYSQEYASIVAIEIDTSELI